MNKKDIENLINKKIPIGSKLSDVEKLLDSYHAEYSYDPKEQNIMALFRNTSRGIIVSGDTQVILNFNSEGKLTSYTVKEIFTGP